MKTIRLLFLIGCGLACIALENAHAQAVGPFALTANNQCTKPVATDSRATVGIYVSGTFSATLQPEGTIQGQAAFNTQVAPSTSTTLQSTITTPGAYVGAVAGWSTFQVCVTAYTSGTATVWLQASESQLGSTIAGGGGGGSTAFNAITSGTNTTATMGLGSGSSIVATAAGTAFISLANGDAGDSALFWTADSPTQGFYNAGGTNEVKVWHDGAGFGADIWGWTGQGNSDLGLFASGTAYIGIGDSNGICTACWSRNTTTGNLRAGTTNARTPIPLEASQYIYADAPCISTGGTCGATAHGWVTIATAATTVTVATTAVLTNSSCSAGTCSHIKIQEDATKGAALGVTCNTVVARSYMITAVTNATSFTVTSSAAPAVNPACLSFTID